MSDNKNGEVYALKEVPENLRLSLRKKSKISNPQDIAKIAAPKTAQILYNALRVGPRVILRSAFELLRANLITRILSAVVLLSIDTISLVRGRISFKQYLIDVTLALMLLVGGTAGWMLGSHLIGFVILEGVVISMLAGLIGAGVLGAVLGAVVEKVIGLFVKDDNCDMLDILSRTFAKLVFENKLSDEETEAAKDLIFIDNKTIRDLFSSQNRPEFAMELIQPHVQEIVNQRSPEND